MSRNNEGSVELFVKNNKEEFIGNILLKNYFNFNQLFSSSSSSKIVISDYSRDLKILNSSPTVIMSSITHFEKLNGLGKYLQERKKVLFFNYSFNLYLSSHFFISFLLGCYYHTN